MKKLNKCDFKKLALLGIAGGTVLGTQAAAANINNFSELLAFNGCGGQHGCHGGGNPSLGGSNGGYPYQAYRNVPSQDSYSYENQAASQPSSGCNSASVPQGQYYQPSQLSSGCHSASAPQGQYYQPSQLSSGCHPASVPQGQGSFQPSQLSNGCGAPSASQGQIQSQSPSAANQRGTYTQWETEGYTADAARAPSSLETTKVNVQRSLTESDLLSQLNDQGKTAYQSLDSSGKALALKLANQDCKGRNDCKGLNSCKTEDHSCAGKGSCAGTANSNFKDKNLAVKVAALKMAEKRANAASSK